MRIGIKFCGGCNQRYDRTALVARLKGALTDGGIEWIHVGKAEGVSLDLVLVVCGCAAACASHQDLTGVHGKLIVHAPEQENETLERLRQLLEN